MGAPRRNMNSDEVDHIIDEWRRERPDVDPASIGTIGRITRLGGIQTILLRGVHERFGLSPAAFDVMASLRRSGPPYRKTAGELADSSLLTSGGVTLRLDRLEADGWVRRVRSSGDRRVVYAELTEKGLAVIDQVFDAHILSEQELLRELSQTERRQLNDLLRKLLRSFNGVFHQSGSSNLG
jgi:DNA-binding MarR family transcriptional regulator